MTVLTDADAIYLGNQAVDALYAGATEVWKPVWTPNSIPGLATWIDASQAPFADGEVITSYIEHSPEHQVFTAQYAPSGPIHRAGAGRPYLEFYSLGGGSGGLIMNTLWNPGTAGLTFVMVNKITGGSYPMHIVWGPDPNGFEMRHDGSSLQCVAMYSTYGIYFSHGTGDAGLTVIHAMRVTGGAPIHAWVGDIKVAGPSLPSMPNIAQNLYVGRREGGYPLFGQVHEALVYAGPISDANQALLWTYLKTKWGLP